MCGRYTLSSTPEDIAQTFDLHQRPDLVPRFNVAPAQLIAVVALKGDGKTRGLAQLRWGFVPYWAHDPNSGPKPINARAETVAYKPPFDHAFREKRCLIPADGFFEWAKDGTKKVGHHFRRKGGGVMAFAGIWDVWKAEGRPTLATCAIITVEANELVRPFHDRMPAVIPPELFDLWMGFDTPERDLLAALRPLPAEQLEVVRVGPAVNKVQNDTPACVAPAA
jgi:putative SOS response-associated peptidase YedK